jgi:hypothetical protein
MYWRFSAILVGTTLFLLALCLISTVWMQATPFRPCLVDGLFTVSVPLLGIIFIVNLAFIFDRRCRIIHAMVLVVIIASRVGILALLSIEPAELRWFRKSGYLEYDRIVQKILLRRSYLGLTNRSLETIVGRAHVFGQTNADGAILVSFTSEGNCGRDGYVYYTGKELIQSADNTNLFYFAEMPQNYYLHITNNWYR